MLFQTRRGKWFPLSMLGVASAMLLPAPVVARTDIEPRIALRQTFSDNVRLTANSKDVGMITTVSPGIRVRVDGGRVQASADYSLDYRIGQFAKVFDKVRHSLVTRVNSELINDFFFVEGGAVATLLSQDLRGSRSINGDNDNPNINNVFTAYVAPVIRNRVGDFGKFEGGYKFSLTNVEDRNRAVLGTGDVLNVARQLGSDSRRHEFFGNLSSGDFFQLFRWDIDAAYEAENIKDLNERYRSKRAVFNGEVPLNRYISVLGSAGYEDISDTTDKINFQEQAQSAECLERTPGRCTVIDQNGLIWDAGFRLSPTPRTELTVRGGRRYGDNVVNVSGFHQLTPKSRISLSYGETLDSLGRLVTQQLGGLTTTFAADERLNTIFIPRFQYLDPTTGLPLEGSLSVNSSTFASRIARIGLQLDRAPWVGTVSVYREDRRLLRLTLNQGQTPVDFDTIRNRRDVSYGSALSLQRTYRGEHKLLFDVIAEKNKYVLSRQRQDSFLAGSVGYSYELGKQITAVARAARSQRWSNQAGADQSETAVTIGLEARF
jgi:uncharacterized protein (PEP-CTERM system associated)